MRKIFLALFLFLPSSLIRADVAIEGETERMFKIINLGDFPEYEFFYMYKDYYYDEGYREGTPFEVVIEKDSAFSAGDRFSTTKIMARKKNKPGEVYESEAEVGGSIIKGRPSHSALVDVIKITGIEGKIIHFKIIKSVKKGSTEEFIPIGDEIKTAPGFISYLLLPAVCLVALFVFFIFRKKRNLQPVA